VTSVSRGANDSGKPGGDASPVPPISGFTARCPVNTAGGLLTVSISCYVRGLPAGGSKAARDGQNEERVGRGESMIVRIVTSGNPRQVRRTVFFACRQVSTRRAEWQVLRIPQRQAGRLALHLGFGSGAASSRR
jgi:hypothetical protein